MNILDYTGTKFINSPIDLPTIGGNSGEIGKTGVVVNIYIGIKLFTVPVDPKTGLFTWTATEAFPDGDYSVSISTVDRAGNVGAPTLRTLRIDTTPPEAPELLSLYDDQGGKQSSFDPGQTTDDKRPKLTGIAQEGTLVYLRDADGNTIGSARADKVTGKWEMEPVQDLRDGDNNLTLVAEETFGGVTREGAPSASFKIVVGDDNGGGDGSILPPDTVAISYAIDNEGTNTGILNHGALTDDSTPELRGIASAGSTVVIYYREAGSTTWTGSATATVDGQQWSWTPSAALSSGSYEFQASIGNISSAPFILQIANPTELVSKTVIEYAIDDVGPNTGLLTNGAITDDNAPILHGRGEANSKIWLFYRNDQGSWSALGTTIVMSDGSWAYQSTTLLRGEYEFKALPVNDADLVNKSLNLKIISEGTNVPEITYANDNVGGYRGPVYSGEKTDDKTPELTGKAEANSIVFLEYQKSGEAWQTGYSVKTDSSGHWNVKNIPELTEGNWIFRAKSADNDGYSTNFQLTILKDTETQSVVEDFNRFDPGTKIASGAIINTGRISSNYREDWTVNKMLYISKGEQITFDLNHSTRRFYLSVERFSNAGGGGMTAYDADGNVVAGMSWSTGNGDSGFAVRGISHTVPFVKVVVGNSSGLTSRIDNVTYESTGKENPNASWLNEDIQDVENNPTLLMMDSNDPDSEFELIQTKEESSEDTLKLTGKNQLVDLADNVEQFDKVNIIDLTGTGDNTLKLDLTALLQHGEKDLFIEDGKTQLVINGDEGDVVQLVDILPEGSDISAWQHQEGTVTVAGVEYNVYSHGDDAELLVQQGVKTELV
jgi:hypothetical protein